MCLAMQWHQHFSQSCLYGQMSIKTELRNKEHDAQSLYWLTGWESIDALALLRWKSVETVCWKTLGAAGAGRRRGNLKRTRFLREDAGGSWW